MSIGGNFWKDSWTGTRTNINTKDKPIYNNYKPGLSGVGASSISNRRAKNRFATIVGDQPGNGFLVYNKLGIYNKYTKNTNALLTPTIPSASTIDSTTRNPNGDLVLNFTLGFNGGSAITDVEYSTDNGSTYTSAKTVLTPIVIPGLSTNASYQLVIRSRNKNGYSDISNSIQTPTIPSVPTLNPISPGDGKLYLPFTLGSDGGSSITDIEYSTDGGTNWTSSGQTSSPIIISNLTNDTTYNVAVRATNAVGSSALSNIISATPNVINISGTNYVLATYTTTTTTSWTAPTGVTSVEYLVVGGGGASGTSVGGTGLSGASGGGGGGMVISNLDNLGVLISTYPVTSGTTYPITVGEGGPLTNANPVAQNGISGNYSEFHTIKALGGGGGYGSNNVNPLSPVLGAGGKKAISPDTPSTGGNGNGGVTNTKSGGGGGSLEDGSTFVDGTNTGSGKGTPSIITGTSRDYGTGGEGNNGSGTGTSPNGAANTGNGGDSTRAAGASSGVAIIRRSLSGGSGIVILRYIF